MAENGNIDILLATYNGERYLEEQILSILKQNRSDWTLLIRDDGSTDNTRAIIERYASKYKDKINFIDAEERTLGALGNFSALLDRSTAPYAMFCDQDDVWLPDKIEKTSQLMTSMERQYGADLPLLVHTDLTVVDQDLNVLSPSFWRYQSLNPAKGKSLNRLLVQNVVTGSTAMINRRLKELAMPVPPGAMMHDWWLALVAAGFGKVDYLASPTVLYRQHGENTLGAKGWDVISVARIAVTSLKKLYYEKKNILDLTYGQAGAFLSRYEDLMSEEDVEAVRAYARIRDDNFLIKRMRICQFGFFMDGLIKNAGLFVII